MSPDVVVDLALVLAVDCSSSVDMADFRLQMDGIAAALSNPVLFEAVAAGSSRQLALTLVQWSSRAEQAVSLPWRLLATPVDFLGAARDIAGTERQWRPGGTGLAAAIDYCAALLGSFPLGAARRVIDVSGDGQDNEGDDPGSARDAAIVAGVTINGLPIVAGSTSLESYYRRRVIGGPGCFAMPAANIMVFREAMARKLLREVQGDMIL